MLVLATALPIAFTSDIVRRGRPRTANGNYGFRRKDRKDLFCRHDHGDGSSYSEGRSLCSPGAGGLANLTGARRGRRTCSSRPAAYSSCPTRCAGWHRSDHADRASCGQGAARRGDGRHTGLRARRTTGADHFAGSRSNCRPMCSPGILERSLPDRKRRCQSSESARWTGRYGCARRPSIR